MALFELEEGRLVPAQFGKEVEEGFTPQVIDAVRAQVLEIVSRPLFPITWRDIQSPTDPNADPRLTALDASGQVVAVEVLPGLTSDTLIDSLSRLADTAAMSWMDLASEYPGGVEGFQRSWLQFRESMPPSPPNGPRLILVAASISDEVRPALDVLSSSGIEVHEMSLRQMHNGRAFLEVTVVGPRMYGHRANLLLGDSTTTNLIEERVRTPISAKSAHLSKSQPKVEKPEPEVEEKPEEKSLPPGDVLAKREPTAATGPMPTLKPRTSGAPFPSRRDRHRNAGMPRRRPTGPWPRSPQALEALGQAVGRPVPLVCVQGVPITAELSLAGVITVAAGSFTDPTKALLAEGIKNQDGWSAWHVGDQYGPTLGEALAELNSQF